MSLDFDDGANRSLYVAADTGAVAARRSTLWRTFDFLWSLHIMDFKNHEDFNTPLLIVATALALVVIVTGIVMSRLIATEVPNPGADSLGNSFCACFHRPSAPRRKM